MREPGHPVTEEAEVVVERLVAGGVGLARLPSGKVALVDAGLPGDRVVIEPISERSDHVRAAIVTVLAPSPHRVEPPCPAVARGCGGCDLQHADPATQHELKRSVVEDSLRRLGGLPEAVVTVAPALDALGYRTTLRCLVVDERLAFRARASHDPVPVERCLVAHPLLDELVAHGRFPGAHEVTLRCGARTGERLVVGDPLAGHWGLPEGTVAVGSDELAAGSPAAFHEEAAGRRWRVSAWSFFQPSPEAAEALVVEVEQAAGPLLADGVRIVDLYGGVGLFAGSLADAVAQRSPGANAAVTLVERSASAAADAAVNLAGIDAEVVAADVERWTPRAADLVVADPARVGLRQAGVAVVQATGAERVVLVSCDAAACGRDTRLLGQSGYRHTGSVVVDQFPMTSHVEVVSTFLRE